MTRTAPSLVPLAPGSITHREGQLHSRRQPTLAYLRSLTDENLLRPYRFQAGLWSWSGTAGTTVGGAEPGGPAGWHWGWEAPTSQLRGHILGHWLSAAAHLRHEDRVLAARSDDIIDALEACQLANGEGWLAPFGPEQLHRLVQGQPSWAPQYVLHKVIAGLMDQAILAGSTVAERLLRRAAGWFEAFTAGMSRDALDDLLDVETGGMLEVWAGMLEHTGDPVYRTLLTRYRRGRLVDALLRGEDVLTDKHANTQIPEILGCARAYEATGEPQWREIVEAFWEQAVTRRGTYVTGGVSSAEVWQPLGDASARTHDVQEHCTVFHMMRLADWLHRLTGDPVYADFWERNLVNGIFAQQHPGTGMVSYFLSLDPGARKGWGTPLEDFWCCHGTLLQAHTVQLGEIAHLHEGRLRISQWHPGVISFEADGERYELELRQDPVRGLAPGWPHPRPGALDIQEVHQRQGTGARPTAQVFTLENRRQDLALELELRIPHWAASVRLDGDGAEILGDPRPGAIVQVTLQGGASLIAEFGMELRAEPLPGDPQRFALLDGPLVLAGLCGQERVLSGDLERPETMVRPARERTHSWWNAGHHHTRGLDAGFALLPLQEITDQQYTVYFSTGR